MVYPNPFSGKATFIAHVQNPQTAYLKVINQVGQLVAQTKSFIQPGEYEFALSVSTAGIYSVTITTDDGIASYKVICTDATGSENHIQYLGAGSNNLHQPGLKTSQTGYTLGYKSGEIILYKCFSDIYTTIMTDSLISSKNYLVEFSACTDPDGKNYPIVKIGYQTWMAENLAYLPSVSPITVGSIFTPYFYVYDYYGSNTAEAKSLPKYTTYGVLYNWLAAMDGDSSSTAVPSGVQGICPSGWHLPSDDEWTNLTDYLGATAGGKMKETGTGHWLSPNTGATNASGFTALPGGYSNPYWDMCQFIDTSGVFWSSSWGGLGAYCRFMESCSDGIATYSQSSSIHTHISGSRYDV
ncbi:MAG: T9SS C-terminal target domain-containing protein [Porphyromonadaceae bacterium]|nr:MAG: T9SS C-terminal target domain-containing protein [Porphyromonadaceae bacterium]